MTQKQLAVRLATTGPISLASAPPIIDGVEPKAGDRILVKNQASPVENGIYIWNGVDLPMTRAPDSPVNPAGLFFEPRLPEYQGTPRGQA
jgi:hypothetical protein